MSQINTNIATILKDHGLSLTKQRSFVFQLLHGSEPMTMAELYAQAKSHLDRASLYRIIAVFEELGIVRRINIGWKYKIELSDLFSEHHHHLTCLKCHKTISISGQQLESFITSIAAANKFMPVEHQVEIQGYCAACG